MNTQDQITINNNIANTMTNFFSKFEIYITKQGFDFLGYTRSGYESATYRIRKSDLYDTFDIKTIRIELSEMI